MIQVLLKNFNNKVKMEEKDNNVNSHFIKSELAYVKNVTNLLNEDKQRRTNDKS